MENMTPFVRVEGKLIVSREALLLAKHLRSRGIETEIVGEDEAGIVYFSRKGLDAEILEPIVIWVSAASAGVVSGLIVEWMKAWLGRRNEAGNAIADERCRIILRSESADGQSFFRYDGRTLTETEYLATIDAFWKESRARRESAERESPSRERPTPIYLEHTPQIVGWGRITRSENALLVEDASIEDKEALDRVRIGELKGLSVTVLVLRATCSTCQGNFVRCEH